MKGNKDFIQISRSEINYRPVKERIKDYLEVEIPLSLDQAKYQAKRCLECGTPFCHGYGCPLSNLIPEWNELLAKGKWKLALVTLLSTNNFPEFTCRVCPAPCESACTANLLSEAVSIRQIERVLIEQAFKEGLISPVNQIKRTGKKVAIIGSGPAGLACADNLNKIGHSVVVFEKEPECGGILMYGIPDFKLEKWVVKRRIELMKKEGIVFEKSTNVGIDIMPNYFQKRFDALVIATGAQTPNNLDILGREAKGILFAMEFLVYQNMVLQNINSKNTNYSAEGKNVVIIGGGDTGADCVGVSIRQGAKTVTQIELLPKPPQYRSTATPWPMWEYKLRFSSSQKEGVKQMWSVKTDSFEKSKSGTIKGLNLSRIRWLQEKDQLPSSFINVQDSGFFLKSDLVILAMGFKKNEKILNMFKNKQSLKIFTCGDISLGASLVVKAMASGRQVAKEINQYLKTV